MPLSQEGNVPMRVEDLLSILREYPPSSRLVVKDCGQTCFETNVADLICRLMRQPPEALVAIFARHSFIVRERIRMPQYDPIAPPGSMWIELDAR